VKIGHKIIKLNISEMEDRQLAVRKFGRAYGLSKEKQDLLEREVTKFFKDLSTH